MLRISNKAKNIESSLTRDLFNRALEYDDVINLSLGDPDLIPPQNVRDAACEAIQKGKTRYSANSGLYDLRNAIADSFHKEYNLQCDPNSEVIVTVGGMEALYLTLSSIINPGDEVIIFAPYYVNYVQMVRMNGGVPVIIETEESDDFAVEPSMLMSKVTDKTVAIIVNTPCNPTGMILQKSVLCEIARIAQEYNLYVITDEVYKSLVYDGQQHHSIVNILGDLERIVLIDSLSKKYAMTGWRLGWAIGPKELISAMTKMQENVAACAPLPSQYAAIEALHNNEGSNYIRGIFEQRRDIVYKAINNSPNLSALKPSATFYIFVNIKKTGLKSQEFALRLLEKFHVAVVPGIAYGAAYDDYIRIAFTHEVNILAEACNRISKFVESL